MTYPIQPKTEEECIQYAKYIGEMFGSEYIPIYIPFNKTYAAIEPSEWTEYFAAGAEKIQIKTK